MYLCISNIFIFSATPSSHYDIDMPNIIVFIKFGSSYTILRSPISIFSSAFISA
jgi:hypothetical protein